MALFPQRITRLFPWLLCGALALSGSLRAQTTESVNIEGVPVKLLVPAGFCVVDRNSAFGKNLHDLQERAQKGVNTVLLTYIDCAELARINSKAQTGMTSYGNYLTPLNAGRATKVPAGYSRQQAIDEIAKAIPAMDAATMQDRANERLNKEGVNLGKLTSGLLGKDENALYIGIAANAAPSGGSAGARVRCVTLMTVLKGYAVSGNLYGPADGGAPFEKLLAAQKKNAALLVKAN